MSDYRELVKDAEAELEFATNGPWTLDERDAHFVLAARELVPALIAALRSVLDEQDTVRRQKSELNKNWLTKWNEARERSDYWESIADGYYARVAKTLSLHDNIPVAGSDRSEWCAECSDPENGMYVSFPCETVRALTGGETE